MRIFSSKSDGSDAGAEVNKDVLLNAIADQGEWYDDVNELSGVSVQVFDGSDELMLVLPSGDSYTIRFD